MKKSKKIIAIMLVLAAAGALFAQKTPYDTADAATRKLIAEIDSLIEAQQYQSAFTKTGEIENEYTLTKKVEIATSYFAQSIMHRMFAFKNLQAGETLSSVRQGTGSYSSTLFDPVEVIEDYTSKNGHKPILDYALAMYYDSVYYCYGDSWLISQDEQVDKIIQYAQSGLDSGYYDAYLLSDLAYFYRTKRLEDKASETYLKMEELGFELDANDCFNLGSSLYSQGKVDAGIPYAVKSIAGYEGNLSYQVDACYLCAQMYTALGNFAQADQYYSMWEAKSPQDYRICLNRIYLYAIQNNQNKSIENAKKLFTYGTTNPSAIQMAMQMYYNAYQGAMIEPYLKALEADYAGDVHALQNIYFHFAYYYYLEGNKTLAAQYVSKAREYFATNGELTDQIEAQFTQMLQ